MFSRTTIASSIRMPIASDRPSSDIVLSVKPNHHTAMKLASTETGSASPVMTVDRHELRNRNTTSTVSTAPSISVHCTFETLAFTRLPASLTISSFTPAGSVRRISSTLARSRSLTAVVDASVAFLTSIPTAGLPL